MFNFLNIIFYTKTKIAPFLLIFMLALFIVHVRQLFVYSNAVTWVDISPDSTQSTALATMRCAAVVVVLCVVVAAVQAALTQAEIDKILKTHNDERALA